MLCCAVFVALPARPCPLRGTRASSVGGPGDGPWAGSSLVTPGRYR